MTANPPTPTANAPYESKIQNPPTFPSLPRGLRRHLTGQAIAITLTA
ncbi:hypothetical protein [Nodosilinea sp. P-1105]|nr:hypothetical protein [Nodosilinea sp. P-1105]